MEFALTPAQKDFLAAVAKRLKKRGQAPTEENIALTMQEVLIDEAADFDTVLNTPAVKDWLFAA